MSDHGDSTIREFLEELGDVLQEIPDPIIRMVMAACYLEHGKYVRDQETKIRKAATADLDGLQAEIDGDQAAKEKEDA